MSLHQAMIEAGVNIHNPQEVFEYMKNVGQVSLDQVTQLIEQHTVNKLNRSEYIQHFKGLFTSKTALEDSVTSPIAGDYASVDMGAEQSAKLFIWDVSDSEWVEQQSQGIEISNSDNVPEGSQNLYFTEQRAIDAITPLLGDLEAIVDEILGE